MFGPIFAKGQVSFEVQGWTLEFAHKNISLFGVTGLPWEPLSSQRHFGKEVFASVKTTADKASGQQPLSFQTKAHLIRERSQVAEHMGVKFDLTPDAQEALRLHIEACGFYPTEYLRKYPRIPYFHAVQSFPIRVIARVIDTMALPETSDSSLFPEQMVFDVSNLSPNGILVSTENTQAQSVPIHQRLAMTIEPRGWFPFSVRLEGVVCRIVDDIDLGTGNIVQYFGIKFTRVEEKNRVIFLDLLRDVLERVKQENLVAKSPSQTNA